MWETACECVLMFLASRNRPPDRPANQPTNRHPPGRRQGRHPRRQLRLGRRPAGRQEGAAAPGPAVRGGWTGVGGGACHLPAGTLAHRHTRIHARSHDTTPHRTHHTLRPPPNRPTKRYYARGVFTWPQITSDWAIGGRGFLGKLKGDIWGLSTVVLSFLGGCGFLWGGGLA